MSREAQSQNQFLTRDELITTLQNFITLKTNHFKSKITYKEIDKLEKADYFLIEQIDNIIKQNLLDDPAIFSEENLKRTNKEKIIIFHVKLISEIAIRVVKIRQKEQLELIRKKLKSL